MCALYHDYTISQINRGFLLLEEAIDLWRGLGQVKVSGEAVEGVQKHLVVHGQCVHNCICLIQVGVNNCLVQLALGWIAAVMRGAQKQHSRYRLIYAGKIIGVPLGVEVGLLHDKAAEAVADEDDWAVFAILGSLIRLENRQTSEKWADKLLFSPSRDLIAA